MRRTVGAGVRSRRARLFICAAGCIATAAPAGAQQNAAGPADQHFALVRPRFSGARALETVAYLDRFVRWPGNAGFDSSIMHVASRLAAAGFVEQSRAQPTDRLTYRIERYPMTAPAWEPLDASVSIAGTGGALAAVLAFATNRNMVANNSWSTPAGGIEAELVRVSPATPAALDAANVRGKIVFADGPLGQLFSEAVVKRGAAGALSYSMPAYPRSRSATRTPSSSRASRWTRRAAPGASPSPTPPASSSWTRSPRAR